MTRERWNGVKNIDMYIRDVSEGDEETTNMAVVPKYEGKEEERRIKRERGREREKV
jgi:hypothetical protein